MLGQSGYSRTMLPNVREIETRLRSLEQELERVGDRTRARQRLSNASGRPSPPC